MSKAKGGGTNWLILPHISVSIEQTTPNIVSVFEKKRFRHWCPQQSSGPCCARLIAYNSGSCCEQCCSENLNLAQYPWGNASRPPKDVMYSLGFSRQHCPQQLLPWVIYTTMEDYWKLIVISENVFCIWSYDHMIIWPYEHMILWSYHPMTIWSYDHMIQWSYDHTIIWSYRSYDHMILWSYDHMIRWPCDPMIIRPYDPMIICEIDHVIIWSYDHMII